VLLSVLSVAFGRFWNLVVFGAIASLAGFFVQSGFGFHLVGWKITAALFR
jgi:hypothetical protein